MHVPIGDTYYLKFTTRAFSTGAPTTLAGTPAVSVYEENNLTQITAGVTLTADYDSVTGLNDVAIVASSGNGYEVGKYYSVVITTGTVDSVSVVGEVVGHFRVMPAEDAGAGVPDVNTTHWTDTAVTLSSTSSKPEVDVNSISDDATAANNAEAFFDGTGYAGTNNVIPTVTSVTNGVTLANGAVTDASLAGNMEIVFETDFATNYNATRNAWATNVQDFVGTSSADPFNGQVVAASVTAEVQADVAKISTSAAAANNLEASSLGIITGTAQTGTLNTTTATTDLSGYADDQLIGRTLVVTSGAADGEATDITDYANASGTLTFTALTTAMGNGDTFVIV